MSKTEKMLRVAVEAIASLTDSPRETVEARLSEIVEQEKPKGFPEPLIYVDDYVCQVH